MKLVDFQFEHLDLFDWRPDEFKMYNVDSVFMKALLKAEEKGECYTMMHDGRILGIGGIVPTSKKTGICFTLWSIHVATFPLPAARLTRRMLSRMMEDMGLHRLVTYNLANVALHHKWCEWLGFKREGFIPKFDDDGNDYIQYGMVR